MLRLGSLQLDNFLRSLLLIQELLAPEFIGLEADFMGKNDQK